MDALQFFLPLHEMMHTQIADRFSQLTDDQMRFRPHPQLNSIAWLLWHMARSEDMAVNRLIAHRPDVLHGEGWAPRPNTSFCPAGHHGELSPSLVYLRRSLMSIHIRAWLYLVALFVLTGLLFSPSAATAGTGRQTVVKIESLGVVTFETGYEFAGTVVGGLSGITYDAQRGVYYALSDDRSEINDARYYELDIDLSDGSLDPGDVTFLGVTFLRDQQGALFAEDALDPEGINLARPGQLFISSEGDAAANPPLNPFVNRFTLAGKQNHALTVPDKFLPNGAGTFGVRPNRAFESLTSNRRYLYTATENPLFQDGPPSTLTDAGPSRLLEYHLTSKRPGREFVYMVSPVPFDSNPPGLSVDNGLVELQTLDDRGTFLAMERSFAVGVGNTVRLFEISTAGATDVSGDDALPASWTPMTKRFVADFELDLGVDPDNLEGMTFGPPLPDGRIVLIVVSDNNFNQTQITQFIALAVELQAVGD